MRVIICQSDIAWEDRALNHQRVRTMLDGQAVPTGSLIVLPEMFATGFGMDVDAVWDDPAPRAGCSSRAFLADLARRHQSVVLAGVVSRDPDGMGRNQAVAIGPDGGEVAEYTKIHPFTLAGEARRYRAGDQVVVFEHRGFTVAPLICYDLRFPERFREAVRLGAQVLVVIANWPSARAAHWPALLAARAIENQAYVVGVNRVGQDPNTGYPGLSTVIDPWGNVLAQANDREAVLHGDLDLNVLKRYRQEFPVLEDMRDDR